MQQICILTVMNAHLYGHGPWVLQRMLDDVVLGRLRASQEEKADNRNKRKAVMLDGHVGPQASKVGGVCVHVRA